MIDIINIKQGGVETPSFTSVDEQYEYAHNLAEAIDNASEVNIEAKIRIPFCAPSDKKRIEDKVGHEVIENEEAYIQFEDNEVRKVLVASTNPKIDANGDGKITIAEAEAATSLPSFRNNTAITSFEELGMFTNVKNITGDFYGNGLFAGCTELNIINLNNIETVGVAAFSGCTSLTGKLYAPKLKTISSWPFSDTKFSSIVLESIKTIANGQWPQVGAFSNSNSPNLNLTIVYFGKELESLGALAFFNCINLETVICSALIPPTASGETFLTPFFGCNSISSFYVPDESVAAYKSADGWSTYASKIKGFSEAPSEMREEYGF